MSPSIWELHPAVSKYQNGETQAMYPPEVGTGSHATLLIPYWKTFPFFYQTFESLKDV
jgi:hypothetical protein